MKYRIFVGLVFGYIVFGCAVKSTQLQNHISSRLNETVEKDLLNKKSKSNLNIELQINKNISLTTNCGQIASSFIPAFFYWGWNSEINGEMGQDIIKNQLKNDIIEKIDEDGLNPYFEDKKLIFTIDELPTKFKFQDKGSVVYLLVAYSMYQKRYFSPELADFKGSYKIVDKENRVVVENNFSKPLTLKAQSSNSKSTKKLSWQYIEAYNVEMNRFVKIVLNEMKTKIK